SSSRLFAVALLFISAATYANSSNGIQTVVSVGIHDSGNAMVTFGASANTELCGAAIGGPTLVISKSNPNFKVRYATALAAMMSGRPVSSYANGCVDIWGNGSALVPQMTLIFLQ